MIRPNYSQNTMNSLINFQEKQQNLLSFFDKIIPILQGLQSKDLEFAYRVQGRLKNELFKVLVIGEFKRGKSTLINALLGESVLPSFSWPCTAVINEIKYGRTKRAILYFKENLPDSLPSSVAQEALDHINKFKKEEIPPLEIPIEKLEEYVVIADAAKDQAESVAETPYSKVEIFWPLEILQNGIEIIDSPGLNEHKNRNDIVLNYIDKADAIIWVLTSQALASMSEIEEVKKATEVLGHKQVFFVCNFFDQIKQAERGHIMRYGKEKLKDYTELDCEKSIHFVSSLRALEAKTGHDGMTDQVLDSAERENRQKESGFDALEKNLLDFLTQERGKIKLVSPGRQITGYMETAIWETIPSQTKMLGKPLEELRKQQDEVQNALSNAYQKKDQIDKRLNAKLGNLKNDIENAFKSQLLSCIVPKITLWAEKYEPKTDISVFEMKRNAEELTKEICNYLQKEIDEVMLVWTRSSFEPFLMDKLRDIAGDIQKDFEDFSKNLNQIKANAFGLRMEDITQEYQVSTWERVLSGCLGLFLGDIGCAFVGSQLGFKDMLISLLPSIGIILAASALNIANPCLIVPTLLGAGGIQTAIKTTSAKTKIKMKTAEEFKNFFQNPVNLDDIASKTGKKITEEIQKIFVEPIVKNLEEEIRSIEDQIKYIIKEKEKGESSSKEKEHQLQQIQEQMKTMKKDIEDFLYSVVGIPSQR